VPDGPDIYVGFAAVKFLFRHSFFSKSTYL